MAAFNAPIPGQSLTDTPGNAPWERPPQLTNPEDALHMHLENLNRPEVVNALADIVNSTGMSVKALTTGIVRNAVAAGRHSVDVGMLIAPVVHEQIKGTLKAIGVPCENGFGDDEAASSRRQHATRMMTERVRKEVSNSTPIMEEEPVVEELPQEGQGLVKRPERGVM